MWPTRSDEPRSGIDRNPVDDPVGHVGGYGDRGRAGTETGAEHDESGYDVVDVLATGR